MRGIIEFALGVVISLLAYASGWMCATGHYNRFMVEGWHRMLAGQPATEAFGVREPHGWWQSLWDAVFLRRSGH